MKRRLLFSIIPAALSVSCVNQEYDISKIEIGDVSGLEGITVPVGSSRQLMLSEILAIEENSEFIKSDEDGNYYAVVSDPEAFDRSITIPDFELDGYDEDNQNDFTIADAVTVPAFDVDFITPPIPFTDVVYDIEIDQTDIPEIISGVSYVEVASALGVTFRYDRSALPFDHITIAAGTAIDFPDWIIVSDPNIRFNKSGDNTFTLEDDLDVASGMSLEFAIEALDFTKLPENQGFVEKGHLHIDADVHLSGAIILKASECSAAGTYRPVISTYMHMDSMDIRNVRLSKVDLGADAHSSMKVDLKEELPDFLYDSGLTYDFNALTLKVDLYNGLPFAGSLTASIDSYQDEGAPLNHVDLTMPVEYQLDVAGNVRSHYFTDINSLLNPLPEYLMVNTEIVIDDLVDQTEQYEDYGLIIPGATYFFDGGYEFLAPLSFGSGFRMELDDEIRNLNLDVTAVDVAEAQLEMNLVNTLPLEIQMSGQAIDAEGNVLEHIAAEFEGTITGGTVDNPSVNAVTVKLTNEGELKLDGVRFRMVARPSGDGVILNRNQYLQLTDIRLSLPQGVTYHVEQ